MIGSAEWVDSCAVSGSTEATRVGRQLRELSRQGRVSLAELSRQCGHHSHYFSKVLRGQDALKVRDLVEALEILKTEPADFFSWLYPFGGKGLAKLRKARGRELVPGRATPEPLRRRLGRSSQDAMLRDPEELTAWMGELLRDLLRRKGVSQLRASLELGLGPRALGNALRGHTDLKLEQVFGALDICGVTPARFFRELFGGRITPPLAAVQWQELLDTIEQGYTVMMERAAARVKTLDETEARGGGSPGGRGSGGPARGRRKAR